MITRIVNRTIDAFVEQIARPRVVSFGFIIALTWEKAHFIIANVPSSTVIEYSLVETRFAVYPHSKGAHLGAPCSIITCY